MARVIMVQGTMSNAGKSLLVAGLCRIFKQDGYRVAPFKSQNMALNSYVTDDGLEIGRAQAMQAEACGISPSVHMNPILLKPTTDMGSQVILQGEVVGNMHAVDYFKRKKDYIPVIKASFDSLAKDYDIIVIEGAGSPAEINLKQDDIVNMGLAKLVDAPVVLVGDIDRGGVFAQLVGTVMLLDEEEKTRIKGLIINKFRGDEKILEPGIAMLEEKALKPVIGVVPYMNVELEDEGSLSNHLLRKGRADSIRKVDVAVIRLPRISNFTDLQVICMEEQISDRDVERADGIGTQDLNVIPGTKNTISDLIWMRENGIESRLYRLAKEGVLVIGICGGYQMLGGKITDYNRTESEWDEVRGIGLLPLETQFQDEKTRTKVRYSCTGMKGAFSSLEGKRIEGYEIHMGKTTSIETGAQMDSYCGETVYGSYIHGIFDACEFRQALTKLLCDRKQIPYDDVEKISYKEYKETQYDKLAEELRKHLDMDAIYKILG